MLRGGLCAATDLSKPRQIQLDWCIYTNRASVTSGTLIATKSSVCRSWLTHKKPIEIILLKLWWRVMRSSEMHFPLSRDELGIEKCESESGPSAAFRAVCISVKMAKTGISPCNYHSCECVHSSLLRQHSGDFLRIKFRRRVSVTVSISDRETTRDNLDLKEECCLPSSIGDHQFEILVCTCSRPHGLLGRPNLVKNKRRTGCT